MCLRPIKIVNKSDRIAAFGGKPILYVPCGCCDQCLDAKKKEYYVRTFAEYQDILPLVESGDGMVYFDTLTYSNKWLPLWHGIQVFNHTHIQLFLKRLRKLLFSAGYPVNGRLRYFICSEYGENTQRPHYHVLFFIAFKIDVLDFWKFVRDAWQYGFNDRKFGKWLTRNGVKFYAPGAIDRVVNGHGALRYVSGYVVKDKSFMNIFNSKVAELVASGYDVEDHVLRSLKPRFFMSRGFGLSFLEDLSPTHIVNNKEVERFKFDQDYYERTGKVTISDFLHLKQDFAIPSYYRRKFYFTVEKEKLPGSVLIDGEDKPIFRLRWKPNKAYKDYLINNFNNIINDSTEHLHNIFLNLPRDYDGLIGQSVFEYVRERLGSRTFKDLSLYSNFYRHRVGYSGFFPVCRYHLVYHLYDGPCHFLDHTSKYTEYDSVEKLSPYIISDRSSPDFKDFDEILDILEGFDRNHNKDYFAYKRTQMESRREYKHKFKNYY